ncbi:MAG: DUF1460 domain-containing protein [Dysgonamonadaceae bacterium]|jgi:hypothetical protein|nr:DUF1460 domain-containing protein [Dysgonamonadaceae bacterium]
MKNLLKSCLVVFWLFIFNTILLYAQDTLNVEDEKIVRVFLDSFRAQTNSTDQTSPNERLVLAARYFMGTPYKEKTLELNEEEDLIINLIELDCTTLIENCIALVRTSYSSYLDFDYFSLQLKYIRYRNGIIQGYPSRLHYMADWITDNINKGIIEDITHAIGGKKFYPQVEFMSSHPNLYPQLKNNRKNTEEIKKIETNINQRTTYYYVPQREISEKQSLIKNGDIICFTTNIQGLDVSHIGIAYWNKGQLTFIHASSKHKKVLINPESLLDYCLMMKNNTGIMVLRLLN